MNYKLMLRTLGRTLQLEALCLLLPLVVCLIYREDPKPFLYTIGLVGLLGSLLVNLLADGVESLLQVVLLCLDGLNIGTLQGFLQGVQLSFALALLGRRDLVAQLAERLLATPPLALEQCSVVAEDMAYYASGALKKAIDCVMEFDPKAAQEVRESEDKTDTYEDMLGTYLLKLGAEPLSDAASEEVTELLKLIGDFERIGDHAVNIIESAEEMHDKQLEFSRSAKYELSVMSAAVGEVMDLAVKAFAENDAQAASCVEPLEQVIDTLKEQMRTRHILRMQQGHCSIEAGFVLSDLLTDLERTSDHCSNIAGCVIDAKQHELNLHATLDAARQQTGSFQAAYRACAEKYRV